MRHPTYFQHWKCYSRSANRFFLLSAHRFFISIDSRLRPAAESWYRVLSAGAPFFAAKALDLYSFRPARQRLGRCGLFLLSILTQFAEHPTFLLFEFKRSNCSGLRSGIKQTSRTRHTGAGATCGGFYPLRDTCLVVSTGITICFSPGSNAYLPR